MLANSPTLLHHPATKKNSAAISYILSRNPSSSRSAQVDVAFPLANQLWGWRTMLLKSGTTSENLLRVEFDALNTLVWVEIIIPRLTY